MKILSLSVQEILNVCNYVEITLYLREGALRYEAPKGAMTQERREMLREYKSDLIEHLQASAPYTIRFPALDEFMTACKLEYRPAWTGRTCCDDCRCPIWRRQFEMLVCVRCFPVEFRPYELRSYEELINRLYPDIRNCIQKEYSSEYPE